MRKSLSALILLLGLATAPAAQLVNGIVAIVNGTVITENEAREYIEPVIEFLKTQHRTTGKFEEEAMKAYRQGLNEMIDRQLMLDDFKESGFQMPERFIEEQVQEIIRDQFKTRALMIKSLEQRGMTYGDFRKQIREDFIVGQMQNYHIQSAIVISPFKIEQYYKNNIKEFRLPDQIRLRMIELNKVEGGDNSAVEKLANEILKKVADGADFKEMATIYSEGAQKDDGGDWGWIEPKVLRKELAEAAALLKAGEVSGLINTPDACYIMRVEKIRIAYVRPLNEVRDEIEKKLISEERKDLQDKYVGRLRKKAFIRFF